MTLYPITPLISNLLYMKVSQMAMYRQASITLYTQNEIHIIGLLLFSSISCFFITLTLFALFSGVFLLVHHLCGLHHAFLLHEGCHHSQRTHRVFSYSCPQCLSLLCDRPCGAPGMAGQFFSGCLALRLPRAVRFTLCTKC